MRTRKRGLLFMLDISNIARMYLAEIGARLRRARKARQMTQAQLAAEVGIARATLSQLESGAVRELGFTKIQRLLAAVSLELLIGEAPSVGTADPVALAATAGSTGFRESLEPDELLRALLTGTPPPRKSAHLRRLLEDSPPQVIRALVARLSSWVERERLERGLRTLAAKLDVEVRDEWMTRG